MKGDKKVDTSLIHFSFIYWINIHLDTIFLWVTSYILHVFCNHVDVNEVWMIK